MPTTTARAFDRIDHTAIDRFRGLERELTNSFPEARKEAEMLAAKVTDPQTANADAIWSCVWNKPLYANTKVEIGKKMIEKLAPYTDGAWQHWGKAGDAFVIARTGKGTGTDAFKLSPSAEDIRKKTNIAAYRLFAIQGAAEALHARALKSETPYADLNMDLSITVPMIQREMGAFWGPITVLHFLADLGLACKPDRHLARTVSSLGMSLNLRNQKALSLEDAIAINRRIRCLVEEMDGSFSPARLRYIDKILMEISNRGLIEAAPVER